MTTARHIVCCRLLLDMDAVSVGRGAPPELVAAADTVTDMTLVKHAFQAGVQAMPGIEW